MERLMMRYLLLSSMLISVAGCSTARPGTRVKDETCVTVQPIIRTATYNTLVNFWGHHFSGLLVFKKTSDTSERAVFITETGFKFFDLQFTPTNFSVIYCLHALNKKVVISILKRNLGYLADFHDFSSNTVFKEDGMYIRKIKSGKKFDYYVADKECRTQSIECGHDGHKKTVVDFKGIKNAEADTIIIHDRGAHLKMLMKKIDR